MKKNKTKKNSFRNSKPAILSSEKPQSVFGWNLLLGIVLCFESHRFLYGFRPNWILGLSLALISALLIVRSFPRKISMSLEEKKEIQPQLPFKKSWGTIVWAVVVVLITLSQVEFRRDLLLTGWVLGLMGLSLVVLLQLFQNSGDSKPVEFRFNETQWLWIIIMVAAVLRFSLLIWDGNFTGLQGDEANNLNDAIAVLRGGIASPFVTGWGGEPTFSDFIVAFFFMIFGIHLWVARLVSILASLVALWFFHHWCRFWMGNLTALMAVFLLGISWWFLYFSFSPFHNSLLLMWQIMAFYFLEKGFREGKRSDFWLTGLCVAASLMNYVAGRSVPVAMFVTVLGFIFFRKNMNLKTVWQSVALMLLGFYWLAEPYIHYAFQYPQEIWGRVKPEWIFYDAHQTGNYFFLLKSYFWTLSSLLAPNPSSDLRFMVPGLPLVDPMVAGFMLIGLAVCLCNLKKPVSWVVLPSFFLGLSANALARIDLIANLAYVQSVRYSIIIPFVFFTCGLGIEWLLSSYQTFHVPKWYWISGLIVATVIVASVFNEPPFMSQYGKTNGSWGEIGLDQIEEANFINKNADKKIFMVEAVSLGPDIYFLTSGKTHVLGLSFDQDIPIPFKVDKDVVMMFAPWRISPAQTKKLKTTYPGAVWTDYKTPFGESYLFSVDIPLDEIRKSQKGMTLKPEPLS